MRPTHSALAASCALFALMACNGPAPEDDSDADSGSDSAEDTGTGTDTGELTPVVCTNLEEPDSGTKKAMPALLSQSECVDPNDPWQLVDDVVPYDINVPFWSDTAEKSRFIAIPAGGTIEIYEDGDFEFPPGTTLIKHFELDNTKIETRFFIKGANSIWTGYSYRWNEEQTDATLLETSEDRVVGSQTWTYPSRSDCSFCHAAAAGGSLGVEIGQINKDYAYADGTMNQISKWVEKGWFATDPGAPSGLEVYPDPNDTQNTLDERARSYLHVNCSQCHRPGGASHLPMDWRIASPMDSATCDAVPNNPGVITDARILAPGEPDRSVMYLRPGDLDWRMPPVGSNVVHETGVDLIGQWITSITSCPTTN